MSFHRKPHGWYQTWALRFSRWTARWPGQIRILLPQGTELLWDPHKGDPFKAQNCLPGSPRDSHKRHGPQTPSGGSGPCLLHHRVWRPNPWKDEDQGPRHQALHPPTKPQKPQQGVDSQAPGGDVGGEQSGWLVGSEWRHYDEESRRAVWVRRALEQDLQR